MSRVLGQGAEKSPLQRRATVVLSSSELRIAPKAMGSKAPQLLSEYLETREGRDALKKERANQYAKYAKHPKGAEIAEKLALRAIQKGLAVGVPPEIPDNVPALKIGQLKRQLEGLGRKARRRKIKQVTKQAAGSSGGFHTVQGGLPELGRRR